MPSYKSTVQIDSEVMPGVTFTLRHLTEGRRIQLSMGLTEAFDEVETLRVSGAAVSARLKELLDGLKGKTDAEVTEALRASVDVAEASRVNRRILAIEANRILPAYVEALLVSVDGLDIDGDPATPETVREAGPPELWAEIVRYVRREMGMSEEELGNSVSPSISSARAAGETNPTSATAAGGAEIGAAADAPSIQSTRAA